MPGVPGMRCPDNQLLLWIPSRAPDRDRLSLSVGARVCFDQGRVWLESTRQRREGLAGLSWTGGNALLCAVKAGWAGVGSCEVSFRRAT